MRKSNTAGGARRVHDSKREAQRWAESAAMELRAPAQGTLGAVKTLGITLAG